MRAGARSACAAWLAFLTLAGSGCQTLPPPERAIPDSPPARAARYSSFPSWNAPLAERQDFYKNRAVLLRQDGSYTVAGMLAGKSTLSTFFYDHGETALAEETDRHYGRLAFEWALAVFGGAVVVATASRLGEADTSHSGDFGPKDYFIFGWASMVPLAVELGFRSANPAWKPEVVDDVDHYNECLATKLGLEPPPTVRPGP